jgi:Zn finger protein HypA/HybF involved in hydrogenase expression
MYIYKFCAFYGLTEKDPNVVRISTLKGVRNPTIPLDKILVEHSGYKNSKLRARLIEEGVLQNVCSECGIGPKWNGKTLSLQLDHINGIHRDNRIENLRILCPNCHTQTDNFGSKNRIFVKASYNCTACGNKRDKNSKSELCYPCSSHSRRKVLNRPEKETIRKQVEELGYCGTARIYGVSDNAVRKWVNN